MNCFFKQLDHLGVPFLRSPVEWCPIVLIGEVDIDAVLNKQLPNHLGIPFYCSPVKWRSIVLIGGVDIDAVFGQQLLNHLGIPLSYSLVKRRLTVSIRGVDIDTVIDEQLLDYLSEPEECGNYQAGCFVGVRIINPPSLKPISFTASLKSDRLNIKDFNH